MFSFCVYSRTPPHHYGYEHVIRRKCARNILLVKFTQKLARTFAKGAKRLHG